MLNTKYHLRIPLASIFGSIFLLIGALPAGAAPVTPRAVGMANNAFSLATGMEALTENPAALALPKSNSWELRILDATSGFGSNALGFSDYRLYNGAELSEQDKADILAKIPGEGWELGGYAEASAAALRVGSFGARVSGFGAARGNIDREMLEILFWGNELDRTYTSELNSGEVLAAVQFAISYGTYLTNWRGHQVSGGLTFRYLRGLYYAELEQAEGSLVAGYAGVTGSGYATATTAEGGSGLAIDWGTTVELGPRYTLSMTLENVPGFIRWSNKAQTKDYSLIFDGITADNFEDSLWVEEESSTSIPSFTRTIPANFRLGLGKTGTAWKTAATFSVGFENRLASSTRPEAGIGVEYSAISFLPLRAGFTVGGLYGYTVGFGGALHLGVWHLEAATLANGGFWPTRARGLTASFACGFHF